jgi:hypothetical protein
MQLCSAFPNAPDPGIAIGFEAIEVPAKVLFELLALGGIEHGRLRRLVHDPPFRDARFMDTARLGNRRPLLIGEGDLLDAGVGVFLAQTFQNDFKIAPRFITHD